MRALPSSVFLLLFILGAAALPAQKTSTTATGDKIRTTERYTGDNQAPLNKPTAPLAILKLKGVLEEVDLEKRMVTIQPEKQKEKIQLSFPQPHGREQVKTSKKAAKLLGKKKLTLEELKKGSKVRLQYYPLLGQVMELIIERPAS